jgi:hypothetical protein
LKAANEPRLAIVIRAACCRSCFLFDDIHSGAMRKLTGAVLVVLGALVVSTSAKKDGPIVTIEQGQLRGKVMETLSKKDMFAFFGIPYAKPPVKELRFKVNENLI